MRNHRIVKQARKMEKMLDGTTGNAASFDGVRGAKWKWRDPEGCYEFCVERDDGRQLNWTIHSIPKKNLYDLERPDGVIKPRMRTQDVKKDLNGHLSDLFGRTAASDRGGRYITKDELRSFGRGECPMCGNPLS